VDLPASAAESFPPRGFPKAAAPDTQGKEVELLTQKKLLAAKIERAMVRQKMTQVELAKAMHTSRTVVHRLLDPHDTSVTLATLAKASKALGVRLAQVA
jgi:DNA-binding Xre family transcriptional regulator